MFGYLQPDLPYLYMKDDKLYKSLYCGVCKSMGKTCGQMSRLTLTFDIAFLSAIAHNIIGCDVEIKKKRCIAHPFKSRPIAKSDELTDKLAALNVILAYHKIEDDIIDSNKGKIKKLFANGGYKKAKKRFPDAVKIVEECYNELRELEKKNENRIDSVSEPFSLMMQRLSKEVLGEFSTESSELLFFYVGKWIYVIDALDDYDKDLKKSFYNPFICNYNSASAKELIEKFGDEIGQVFNDIFSNVAKNFENIKFVFNKDLVANILLRGIPMKTQDVIKKIVEGKNKVAQTNKNSLNDEGLK